MNWVWEMIKWMTTMFKTHYASLQWNRNSVDRPRPMGLLFNLFAGDLGRPSCLVYPQIYVELLWVEHNWWIGKTLKGLRQFGSDCSEHTIISGSDLYERNTQLYCFNHHSSTKKLQQSLVCGWLGAKSICCGAVNWCYLPHIWGCPLIPLTDGFHYIKWLIYVFQRTSSYCLCISSGMFSMFQRTCSYCLCISSGMFFLLQRTSSYCLCISSGMFSLFQRTSSYCLCISSGMFSLFQRTSSYCLCISSGMFSLFQRTSSYCLCISSEMVSMFQRTSSYCLCISSGMFSMFQRTSSYCLCISSGMFSMFQPTSTYCLCISSGMFSMFQLTSSSCCLFACSGMCSVLRIVMRQRSIQEALISVSWK